MNLTEQTSHNDLFPDSDVPFEDNCFKYVYYKLGFESEEMSDRPSVSTLESTHFRKTNSIQEADAIGMKGKYHGRYEHIVHVNKQKGNKLFHKVNGHQPVTETNITALRQIYPESKYQFIYLKKREKEKYVEKLMALFHRLIRRSD